MKAMKQAVKPKAAPKPAQAVAITPITYNKAARSYGEPKAAPLPLPCWRASVSAGGHQGMISDDNDPTGRTIALTYDPKDAEPIARAVNSHAAMVEAANARINEWHGDSRNMLRKEPPSVLLARAALKLAGEEA